MPALPPATMTRLEKAAVDNGFDRDLGRDGEWRHFTSSFAPLHVWLSGLDEDGLVVALSRGNVAEAIESELGSPWVGGLPAGAMVARVVSDFAAMGGRPEHFLITLALSPETAVAWAEDLYRGIGDCLIRCRLYALLSGGSCACYGIRRRVRGALDELPGLVCRLGLDGCRATGCFASDDAACDRSADTDDCWNCQR